MTRSNTATAAHLAQQERLIETVARAMAEACRPDHDWPFWREEAIAAIRAIDNLLGDLPSREFIRAWAEATAHLGEA